MTLLRRLAPQLLFWGLFAAVAVAQLLVVIPGITMMRLWEDEAFNLTVPVNLLAGLGYTSDGTLSGSQLTPFDPRISTGPVVLLPIAAVLGLGGDLAYGSRSVMLVFYLALLVGLWVLGNRIGRDVAAWNSRELEVPEVAGAGVAARRVGRWAGLAAVSVPLGLNTWESGSPIQSPVDVLGEVPTAALLVWALYFALSRPWLAGLLVGLAMQAKTIGLLGAPAIALAVFLAWPGRFGARFWRVVRCGLFALMPLLAFEAAKLLTLGPAGYAQNTYRVLGFLLSGGQHVDPVAPGDKLNALFGLWFAPELVVVLLVIVALVVAVLVWLRARSIPADLGDQAHSAEVVPDGGWRSLSDSRVLFAASLLGLATWAGWWMVSSHTPIWIRHPSPGLFAFVPLLAAALVGAIGLLWHDRSRRSAVWVWASRSAAAVASVALFLALALNLQGHLNIANESRYGESLSAQRAAAAEIATLGEPVFASSWGPEVAITVLAGSQAALSDAPGFAGTPRILRNYGAISDFDAAVDAACQAVPMRVGAYAVCIPR